MSKMTAERRKKMEANKWGCKPVDDTCVEHDAVLTCKHGCESAKAHQCTARSIPRPSRTRAADAHSEH